MSSTEDGAERNFPFLFGKSVVLVPRPHQIFDFKLVKATLHRLFDKIYSLNRLQYSLYTFYYFSYCFFEPKMPYYGLITRAQAVVIKALGTPLKLIT